MLFHLDAPDLSGIAIGGATLYLLEGIGFSNDGKTLLVRATYTDDADADVQSTLHQAIWTYDGSTQTYGQSLNGLLKSGVGGNFDISNACIAGVGNETFIVATATPNTGNGADPLLVAFQNGVLVSSDLLNTTLGLEVKPRIEHYALSGDGRFLALQTDSSSLAQDTSLDTNDVSDIYLIDLLSHKVERVSFVSGTEVYAPVTLGNVLSASDKVSVAFTTEAAFSNKDTNGGAAAEVERVDAYVWSSSFDQTGLIGNRKFELLSQKSNGISAGHVTQGKAFITQSGGYFESSAETLVTGDNNQSTDVFFRNTLGQISRILSAGGSELENGSSLASVSTDGSKIGLLSDSPELVGNNSAQLFSIQTSTNSWGSISTKQNQFANDLVFAGTVAPNGKAIVFSTNATNLTSNTPVTFSGDAYLYIFNELPTGTVTINGTLTQGQALTASNTLADADGMGSITYQWQANGSNISGATGGSYTLTQAEVGKTITVIASYTDGQGTAESQTSAVTTAVVNVNDAPTGSVTITGTATQSETLTASNTLADIDGLGTITYQWQAGGNNISGATGNTYTLTQAEVGKTITVIASYTDGQNTAESKTSAATIAVFNVNDAPTGSITITGAATQGQTLTASNTLADVDGLGIITYQWQANGTSIDGATGGTYTLTQAEVGKTITVIASYTDKLGTAESQTSSATGSVVNVNDAPTGSVTITGTATQGQTLTANNTLADADGIGNISYQWQANDINISGATGSSYTLTQTEVGKTITVTASYTDKLGTAESQTSATTSAVVNVNDAPTGSVTISGTAAQGQLLTANNSLADIDGLGTIAYQWQANNINISGATGSSYTLTQAEVGTTITVIASYTDGQNTAESKTSAATTAVVNVNDAPTGSVTITGTATQGQTLTANNTLADIDGLGTISYQWQANDTSISGATGKTYTLTQAEVGKTITIIASYTDELCTAETKSSAATSAVVNVNDAPTGSVTITGTAAQGQTLTASNTLADADGIGSISYQWQANDINISGATGSSYTLTQAEVGKTITVIANYTDKLGTAESQTSAATSAVVNVNDVPTGSVTITGTAAQGQTLTASNTLADADGIGSISYQWQANDINISGATGSSYTLTQTEVGKTITVTASYTDKLGTAESQTSAATSAVVNVNDAPTGSVTISGTAAQGQLLTANNSLADIDGLGIITYQWQANDINISGATGNTYTLTQTEVSKTITVIASYTDGQNTAESKTSAATTAVLNVNDAPTGSVTITGTATQEQTLTASNTLADADGIGSISYQWQANDINISGATGSSYTLTQTEVGKTITVTASYTDKLGTAESQTSAATSAVVNVNDAPTGSVTISGTAAQGQLLTANNSLADIDGLGIITYQWQANDINISGATGNTYTLTQTEVSKTITVIASYTDGQNTAESKTSAATTAVLNVNDAPTGSVTITGTVTQGQTLTANNTLADADGIGNISYQWQANDINISGATGSSYTLTQTEVGKTITVTASYTDKLGTAESQTSAATSAVVNVNDAPTGSVTISGTAAQGQLLTANNSLADIDGLGIITYQWQANDINISGATGNTYTLTQTEVSKTITVIASYTDGQNTAESKTSAATTAVLNVNDAPTGSVTITGTATQGQTLTANNTLADADGIGNISYQWQANDINISGATGSSYTLTQTEVGKTITVTASYTDKLGTAESQTSAATSAVVNVNDAPTGSVTISGTAAQGQLLTANNSLADIDGLGIITYQWQANDINISGATGNTYTLTQTEVGKTITVIASYTDGQNTAESKTSAATTAVVNVNDAPTGSVTITGTATQGQTLTANNTLADADGIGNISYQWQANDINISGATGSSYTLTQTEVGKTITVTASYTDKLGTAESQTSAATSAVVNVNDAPTGSVTISGTAAQGQLLTANNSLADIDGLGIITYQWQANDINISGATGNTYTLTQTEVGKTITVIASYTDGQNTAESKTSAATTAVVNVNDAPTGSVTITGTATQGQTLTASNSLADIDGLGAISYQWQANDTSISGATDNTYTLTQAEVGKVITVIASYTDKLGTAESQTSAATTAVVNVNDAPTGSVTITGTATQGQTLTANNSLADIDGLNTITYQWQAGGNNISGATDNTYTLTQAEVGKTITVIASYTDGQNTAESKTSAATTAVLNVNDAPTGSVTITGTATQGQTLTANNSLADIDGLNTITYQWQAGGNNISGATDNTYTLTQAEVGKTITVIASYTDGQNTAESKTSAATTAVLNVNDAPTGSVTITGTATQGQTLTANNTLADADGIGNISYQWQANDINISGATGSSYTLTQTEVGKTITVTASYTDKLGTAESQTSAATSAVVNVNDAPTGSVTISGTAAQGQLLTANNSLADIDGLGIITYQWQANDINISGATGNTYTLTQTEVSKTITVIASYTDGQNTAESKTSAATTAVLNVNDAPTGSITITGTATQGQTLTASNTLADIDGLGIITYQWQANGTSIGGATGGTYTLTQAEVGKTITVTASYTDGQRTAESQTSAATSAVVNVNDVPTGSVTITGTATQGATLTASNTLADIDGLGTIAYQWQAGGNNISGATGNTYTLTQAEVGKVITVIASYTDGQNTAESKTSAATTAVVNVNDAPTGSVTITGNATQGQTLTASNSLADADGIGNISYQWQANDINISGATGSSYTLTQAAVGKTITVTASYTDKLGTAESQTSAATSAVVNVNDAPTGSVTISGTAAQGQLLTANNSLADIDGLGIITYQWQANDINISGATGNTYTLTQTEVGKTITVIASYTDGQNTAESKTSAATTAVLNVNDAPTGSVTITGTATQGQTLTANNTLADIDGLGTITYQWQAGGNNISGATGNTYTLTQAEVGKVITVIASYTDKLGTAESQTSATTTAVLNVNDTPTGSVTITGTATQGQLLTASNSLADIDGLGTITYQWQAGENNISGATGNTYTLTQAEVGKTIMVIASYTDEQNTTESQTSAATTAVVNVNDTPTGSVTITGIATQGQTLTANNTLVDIDGLGTITYQWQAGGNNISGATGNTYTLTQAEVGKTITVIASYTDGQNTAESKTSAATTAVVNVNDVPTGSITITGTATQGQTLTANNTLADIDGLGTITYQWQANDINISGATGNTYTQTQTEVGKTITVIASYTDGQNTAESKTSAATTAVVNVNDAPTGSVTITGTVTQGQTLTASNTLADADGIGSISYQWQANDINISGATSSSYTLTQTEVGKTITVIARYTDKLGTAESQASAATSAVVNVNDEPTGSVTISGVAKQGEILTADNTLADIDGLGAISYQWQANDTSISGATGETYTLTQAEVGKTITVIASYTDKLGTAENQTSAATTAVVNVNDTPTGSVTITGTATQGQTLTASNTLADIDGLGTITYQWQANGTNIGGATGGTYILTQAEVGKTITVTASYTDEQGTAESQTSAATTAVVNVNDTPTGSVTITGTATQGQLLTANNTLADIDGLGTITYQWKANGTSISGATGETYTLTQAEVGKAITVSASYTDGQNTAESKTSAATTPVVNVNDVPTGSVTITGTATQGQILTANNTLADIDGLGTISYQWQANDINISGATGGSYTLTQAEVGKVITVTASYTDGQNTAESKTSAATTAVVNVNDAPTGSITISGTATQGQTLTASNSLTDIDGLGTITYQWQAGGTNISGATGGTYTLTQAEVGKTITVIASYTDEQGTAESKSSAATTAVINVNDVPTGSVTITGTATQGQTLTASNSLADIDGLGTITYQWQANGTNISGATGGTYTLTQAEVGKVITVIASYTDGFGTAESKTSAATTAVVNVNDTPTGSITISGTATQGQLLTASNSLADADGMGNISYQWQAGGININGATGVTYTLTQAEVGKTITVTANYTDKLGTAESQTSAATTAVINVNDKPTGSVTITGTAKQGETLTANNTLADIDGLGTITYQWQAGGTNISGATGGTYTLTQAEVGKTVTVTVSYTDGQNTAESQTSAATTAVINVNDEPTGSVTITGTATQGQTLTASNSLADIDSLGTITYQWQANGTNISGATGETYTLTQAEVGKAITVTASYTDEQGTAESQTSAATTAVVNVNDTPTGSVTITGTATQGQLLTANNTLADIDGLGTITYQWKANGTSISGATGETYTLTQAEVGKAITVSASYTDGQNTAESKTSAATTAVINVNDEPTGSVTITGTATQGQTLTASNSLADIDSLGTITYQWQANGTNISGATGETYTLTQAEVGKAITVSASYTDGQNTTESKTSAATTPVVNVNDTPTGSVTITGTATQGQLLTANNTLADIDGLGTITYQWKANGTNISGATGETYTLTQAEVGKAITVSASYTDGQNTAESKTSAATTPVVNVNDVPTGSVTITGTATQGQTLTASNSLADIDSLGTITYQWQANGTNISGATGETYTLTQAEVGKAITVSASYTDGQNTTESKTSAATTPVVNVNDTPTGSVTITGTATQGQLLTANNTLADIDGLGTITYQWKANGTNISGATGETYTLTQAEVGKTITVTASYTDEQGTAESQTSAATTAVVNVNDTPTGSVTITGTATQGQLLTANNTLADIDGLGTITYQWQANDINISGATSNSYTLTQAEVGKTITVIASYTDGQGTAESKSSAATTAIINVNDVPTGSVTITGTAKQGETLTASNSLADIDGLGTITYQWQASGANISGATGGTYTLTQAEVGKVITVIANYTDGQGIAESQASTATSAVVNVNDAPTGSVTITGTATQGQTLTANNTLADIDGLGTITYQWKANGTNISGATGETYTLTQAEVGKTITAIASYTDGQNQLESLSSLATPPIIPSTHILTPTVYKTLLPQSTPIEITGGTVAKIQDAVGAQTITIQAGGKLDLDGALGNNLIVFEGLAFADVTLYRSGQEVHVVQKGSDQTIASIPVTVTAQTLRFSDTDKTLQLSGGPQLDGLTIASDKQAPSFQGASVNGNTLIFHYSEELSTHLPSKTAFEIKINGQMLDTSAFEVSKAVGKELWLNLHTTFDNTSTLSVAYTDTNSASNDMDAIQDITGNDANSFSATLIKTWYALSSIPDSLQLPKITNYVSGQTVLALEDAVFQALQNNHDLSDSVWFSNSNSPQDANDFLIFNPADGTLAYDADGSANENTPVPLVQLVGISGTELNVADLLVI